MECACAWCHHRGQMTGGRGGSEHGKGDTTHSSLDKSGIRATERTKELRSRAQTPPCKVRIQHVITRDQCHNNFSSKSLPTHFRCLCLTRPVLAPPSGVWVSNS